MKVIILCIAVVYAVVVQCEVISKQGILIIPGIGRGDRLRTTIENLSLLQSYLLGNNPSWDCVAYIYALHNDSTFWSLQNDLLILKKYCSIVENPGRRVTENLYLAQPALMKLSYKYVFVLLDDCKLLGKDSFRLDYIVEMMTLNHLTVVSPKVVGANKGGGQQFRNIMQVDNLPNSIGYASVFVELFAWITTMDAYEALWELLCPSVNPYGWGYDLWYHSYATDRVVGHRMGIISVVSVKHEQNLLVAGGGRTERATVEQKWNALQAQELHYRMHLGIHLKKCRLKLANSTLYGAVTGLLYDNKDQVEASLSSPNKFVAEENTGNERTRKRNSRLHAKSKDVQ